MHVLFSVLLLYEFISAAICEFHTQECGVRYAVNRHKPTISHGHEAEHLEYPWHIALYRQYNASQEPEYICGGSIIHQDLIVTDIMSIEEAAFFAVAGKHNRRWTVRDSVEQRFRVTEIRLPTTFVGLANRYADDIAILALNDSIEFSSVVMPVCIDWNAELNVNGTTIPGTVVGWGYNENGTLSNKLMVTKLDYFNFTTCRDRVEDNGFSSFVTSDKFCAGVDNGTAVEQGDSGGGFVVPRNSTGNTERYYLYGIVSTKDTWTNRTAAFTDVSVHLRWINSTIASIIKSGSCAPLSPDSNVELTLCDNEGLSINCEEPAKPGTKAKVRCKSNFHKGPGYKLYANTICNKNRIWSPLTDSCLECGKRYNYRDFQTLTSDEPKKISEFPWHIGLYISSSSDVTYICGGSIIHPKAVLSAAHCLESYSRGGKYKYYVVAGKFNVSWLAHEPNEQRFQVSEVYMKETYKGRENFFADDIAILKLNATIKLSELVMPACIDWSTQLQLHTNPLVTGLCIGWGWLDSGVMVDTLKVSRFLYLDWDRCYEVSEKFTKLYLTKDKLCATGDEGIAELARGFSGGSLTFPRYDPKTRTQTNYLYGVVSLKGHDNIFRFTNVLYHVEWIQEILVHNITKEMKKIT